MPRLQWVREYEGLYNPGVDRGVFYPPTGPAETWGGLMSVEFKDDSSYFETFFEGIKVLQRRGVSEISLSVETLSCPASLKNFIGQLNRPYSSQSLEKFAFSYRSGTKTYLLYNLLAYETSKSYLTDSADKRPSFSKWDMVSTPIMKSNIFTEVLVFDTKDLYPWVVKDLEEILYGGSTREASMPDPDEILALFEEGAILKITDLGDGTWTAEGPDSIVSILDETTFSIDWASVELIDSNTFTAKSQ